MARVLVVEDEPGIMMVLNIALTDKGHQVIEALDGGRALELLQRLPPPEIILMDLNLPVVNGRVILERISANPVLQNIPVIVLSGSVPSPDNLPPGGGYSAFLGKPFDLTELLDTVDILLEDGTPLRNGLSNYLYY